VKLFFRAVWNFCKYTWNLFRDICTGLYEALSDQWNGYTEAYRMMDESIAFMRAVERMATETETEMDALKLDVDRIRKRVLDEAVVVKKVGKIYILIPACDDAAGNLHYFSLTSGSPWPYEPKAGSNCDWIIRPGDEAEFSDDGKLWTVGKYRGIDGIWLTEEIDFRGPYTSNYRFIRPVQTDPEKKARQERIQNLENELNKLKKLEGME